MKTAHKQILALLALVLLLSLCACAQKTQPESDEPKMSTDKVDFPTKADKKTPEKQPEEAISQSDMSNRTSRNEAVDTQPVQYGFSQEAKTSLGWLRDRIEFPMTMFGAAYLGYVGGLFEEGFEAGFPPWLRETNEARVFSYRASSAKAYCPSISVRRAKAAKTGRKTGIHWVAAQKSASSTSITKVNSIPIPTPLEKFSRKDRK